MAEKKILMVIPPRDFQDEVYETCRRLWEGRGYRVSVASFEPGAVRGMQGTVAPVDVALGEVKYYNYDAIVFLGGDGATLLFDDEKARKLAKDAKYKVLGATGNAAILLALSGAAEGKKVTGPSESAGLILQGKATFTGRPIEVDGKLITIQDASMAEHLANAVVKALE